MLSMGRESSPSVELKCEASEYVLREPALNWLKSLHSPGEWLGTYQYLIKHRSNIIIYAVRSEQRLNKAVSWLLLSHQLLLTPKSLLFTGVDSIIITCLIGLGDCKITCVLLMLSNRGRPWGLRKAVTTLERKVLRIQTVRTFNNHDLRKGHYYLIIII